MSRIKPQLPSDPSPSPLPTQTSTHSFWHSQPSSLLTAHRSTRDLPDKADVVIIGSGMTGASIAHHLLNDQNASSSAGESKKLSVVMLEAREACWGATGRNGGHCQPLLLEHPDDPSIPAFELLNFRALHSLSDLKQTDCEFVPQPGVRAIYSLSNLHETELALHTLQHTLPEMAQLTRITRDEDELAALRVPGALGAVVTNVAARMWPYKFVARILEDLLTASNLPGGDFNLQTLTPVTSLCRASSGADWHICTDRGNIKASKAILATNAYTSHLLPALRDLIVPVRGQMSALHPLPSVAGPNRLQTSFGFAGEGIDDYLIQRPNETGGHLMFGGGRQCLPCIGETDDSVIDDETARYLRRRLVEALGLPEGKGTPAGVESQTVTRTACENCHRRKIHCSGAPDALLNSGVGRCTQCARLGEPCGPISTTTATIAGTLKNPYPPLEPHPSYDPLGVTPIPRDNEQSDEKGQAQSRTAVACEYCRKRKIRCHGLPPLLSRSKDDRCANCVRFSRPCGAGYSNSTLQAQQQQQQQQLEFQASHEWTGIMGFSRDDLPWVGPVPASLLSDASDSVAPFATTDETGLYIAAGYTGHGMPNTWLCGAAVAKMAMGHTNPVAPSTSVVDYAVASTGLPRAYVISEERIKRARELEGVGARDWTEMRRGKGKGDRPVSGYA